MTTQLTLSSQTKFAVLGTGMVGEALANKLVSLGYAVKMGAREASNERAAAWSSAQAHDAKARASHGTFADAASFGDIIVNCTSGQASLAALSLAGAANLAGKVLIDIANPLDFSNGMPPTLSVCNTDSLGEQIQRAFPEAKVVKTLNTVNCNLMVNAKLVGEGKHSMFMSGNDKEAKAVVANLLREGFGWSDVIDLGDISTARGTESLLPLWLRLWGALGTPNFNVHVVR